MGRKLNLSHLSEGECRQILDVIQRDFSIRQREKERLVKLQKLVKDEEQKRLVLSRQKQFNEKYCICCFSSFGLIFNKRTECKSCGFFICRDCSVKPEGMKNLMCLGCSQQRELQVQVCEWFYGQIRNRFRRFGSAKVVRSLYKRDGQSYASDSLDHSSNDSGVGHQLSPSSRELLPEEATKAFMETLEKHTSTANKELLGVPYKALLENQDWLSLFKPSMSSVAVQAPEDVLPDVLDSRQALEDFVFNLPPEEEELDKSLDAERNTARRYSGPEVVVLDPEGEPLGKGPDSNRKVHFGDMPTPAKSKDASLASSSTTGAAYHVLSPIEEVLSSPEMVDKYADTNGNNVDASACSGDSLKDRGSIDRLSLGEDENRARTDSSSTISPHDWDSGIHMSLCLSQDGGWEVSQITSSSGMDSIDGPQAMDLEAKPGNMISDSVDSFASMSLASLDANDTLDSLETHYNSIHSDTPEISDEFVSSSSTIVDRNINDDNEESMSGIGIEIEQLTLSRSSSEETIKTDDDDDDMAGKVGDLTMQEFLDQLTNLSLSVTSESADEFIKDGEEIGNEDNISPPPTEETSLESTNEDAKQEENLNRRMNIAEESQPLLGEEEDEELEFGLPKMDTMGSPKLEEPIKDEQCEVSRKGEGHSKAVTEEKHLKCTKSHHHHSSRSHVHDPAARSKSTYKRTKSSDDFILSGRSGEVRNKSNGSKSHRRDGEPVTKCTKESHHHGKHHERSPTNRFIRYDSLPLVVEVFEAEGNYHWHHHNYRDIRQFSRESDSNDSEPSNRVTSKTSRSGAKLVRAPHLSPKSSYEEEPTCSQSRQLSTESNTTEDTMPKSTSQSSGPTTPESRRDSQMAGMSSEDSSKEDQRSPDKPLHYSPTDQINSIQCRASHGPSKLSPSGMDYPVKKRNIQDAIDSLQSVNQGECATRKSTWGTCKEDGHSDSLVYQPEGNGLFQEEKPFFMDGAYSPESQLSQTMPRQTESSPHTLPRQSSPLTPSSHLPPNESRLLVSPSTPPTQLSPGSSPMATPNRMSSLRKDILELANLSKKVSITQEEMLQSAEEVLTSAHKMSSIQSQVEELEDVLDSLERTVIGESSSLYGSSSSENEDSVVGPQEQVVEDMELLEQQLACSHTDDIPSETNAATAVRMITTTALKLLSTTEDAMKSHSATLASPTSYDDGVAETESIEDEGFGQEGGNPLVEDGLQEIGSRDLLSHSRSSGVSEMCACSSTDGSRPNSLTLDDALTRTRSHSQPDCEINSRQSEQSRQPSVHGVSFLHLHSDSDQGSPPIATLMCETDDDVRNGNGFSAASSPYQNGDSAMLDDADHQIISPKGQGLMDSTDLTFDLNDGLKQERATERRRRKERKLRKSSGYKTSPARDDEVDLLLYNQMADLEEKVYLSAGKVFTLEERLQRLQEQVSQVDRTSPEENIIDLEDKIALTMAQVAQSECQVAAVEAQIAALQQSRQSDVVGYDSGQFGTVSVAMCDLSSPERYSPFAYGSCVQIQIPRERVDSPVDFVMEIPRVKDEYNNEDGFSVDADEVELEMGVIKDEVDFNGSRTEPFGVERCEVSVELRPIKAVIVRYLQEGDDETLWPDFRFNRNKIRKHDGEKRPKLHPGDADDHQGNNSNSDVTEHHTSTFEIFLGYSDELPAPVLDGLQEVTSYSDQCN